MSGQRVPVHTGQGISHSDPLTPLHEVGGGVGVTVPVGGQNIVPGCGSQNRPPGPVPFTQSAGLCTQVGVGFGVMVVVHPGIGFLPCCAHNVYLYNSVAVNLTGVS